MNMLVATMMFNAILGNVRTIQSLASDLIVLADLRLVFNTDDPSPNNLDNEHLILCSSLSY